MIKKIVLRFFTFIAILFLVDQMIKGFDFVNVSSLLSLAAILTFFSLILKPIIQFFTLPINFFTFGLFNFLVSCAALYIFDLLIAGFDIKDGTLNSINSQPIIISDIRMSTIGVIIVASLFISLLNNIIDWTQSE